MSWDVKHMFNSLFTPGYSLGANESPKGKRRVKGLVWLPIIRNGIAHMKSGTQYRVQENGWRRIRPAGNGSAQ